MRRTTGFTIRFLYSISVHFVSQDKFRAICRLHLLQKPNPQPVVIAIFSAIDKLDKEPWEAVRKEMVDKKGLPGDVADKLQV